MVNEDQDGFTQYTPTVDLNRYKSSISYRSPLNLSNFSNSTSGYSGPYINTDNDSNSSLFGDIGGIGSITSGLTNSKTNSYSNSGSDSSRTGFFDNVFSDEFKMGNIAGLASTLMQAAALPSLMENAKLQNRALRFNLDTAKSEQARRNNNVSGFNSFKAK